MQPSRCFLSQFDQNLLMQRRTHHKTPSWKLEVISPSFWLAVWRVYIRSKDCFDRKCSWQLQQQTAPGRALQQSPNRIYILASSSIYTSIPCFFPRQHVESKSAAHVPCCMQQLAAISWCVEPYLDVQAQQALCRWMAHIQEVHRGEWDPLTVRKDQLLWKFLWHDSKQHSV